MLPAAVAPRPNRPATGQPTITGVARVGETLTADTSSIADADGLDNAGFVYQWLTDDAEIQNATGSSYILANADEGITVKVRISFTDDAGNQETLTSAATDAVSAATQPNDPATGAPAITGTVQVGETLTAGTTAIADEDGLTNVSYTYQWLADDTAIQGATSAEAPSSQGEKTSGKMSAVLGGMGEVDEEETTEDAINKLMESRKLLTNASYFAFTATPKNQTLEIFGESAPEGEVTKHKPFHVYSMKQAIQEGFIMDVLKSYTPVDSYYRLIKTVDADPEFDAKRARRKLRRLVENHEHAIRLKAEIMTDHFLEQVIGLQKMRGHARAMVVTGSIQRAITYYHAIRDYLAELKSPYQAIVAFLASTSSVGPR